MLCYRLSLMLLVGLTLASASSADVHWGPRRPLSSLPRGWQGDCVQRPRALAQCGIWRDSAGLVRLLITHYVEGNQSVHLYLPASPPVVRVEFISGTPHRVFQVLAPASFGWTARALEASFQACSRIIFQLDYLPTPKHIPLELDGLPEALRVLRSAVAQERHTLAP